MHECGEECFERSDPSVSEALNSQATLLGHGLPCLVLSFPLFAGGGSARKRAAAAEMGSVDLGWVLLYVYWMDGIGWGITERKVVLPDRDCNPYKVDEPYRLEGPVVPVYSVRTEKGTSPASSRSRNSRPRRLPITVVRE